MFKATQGLGHAVPCTSSVLAGKQGQGAFRMFCNVLLTVSSSSARSVPDNQFALHTSSSTRLLQALKNACMPVAVPA